MARRPDRSNIGILLVLVLVLAGFGWGLVRLFQLRFAGGDVYPPYSSLRTDPVGVKALHDALAELEPVSVVRNRRPLTDLTDPRGTTVMVLGVPLAQIQYAWSEVLEPLEQIARGGGRLVLTFYPVQMSDRQLERWQEWIEDQEEETEETDDDDETVRLTSAGRRWGLRFGYQPIDGEWEDALCAQAAIDEIGAGEDHCLDWYSGLVFEDLDPVWRVVYEVDGEAVIIERAVGGGTLVLCADSHFASNEALREGASTEFLAWLIGSNRSVMFDETHLGVQENPGVAMLMRKYRLHGLVAALVLLAGLFIWRSASSLLPAYSPPSAVAGRTHGKHAAAGLVSLLRRSVPPQRLMAMCVTEWKRVYGPKHPAVAAELERVTRETLEPVKAFRQAHQIVSERKPL